MKKSALNIWKHALWTVLVLAAIQPGPAIAKDSVPVIKNYLTTSQTEAQAYSQGIATNGGKIVWRAGVIATVNEDGNSIANDFKAQAHAVFRTIRNRRDHFGGKLSDIVTITVYIRDARYAGLFAETKKPYFKDGDYPSSALITVVGFADPDALLEIKATAVVGMDKN